ncbi:TPA: hypothetical protein VQL86_000237 [Streptococcus pneumoniae]|uniref:hypothetical protein n=1 Tax=Streptococcus mitis TaxID=28037 RepID=UPI0021B74DB5|nr:hypothetical protein [Streptococcus mitis]HET0949608.1 hypothetical protein [Streptococcus pneumoniae]
MVVSYTVFLAMKFLTLRSLPTESVGLFELFLIQFFLFLFCLLIVFYYTGLTPLQTLGYCLKLANVCSDDQFKELALYTFQNLF